MTNLLAQPPEVMAAAVDVAEIGAAISQADAASAVATTDLIPAVASVAALTAPAAALVAPLSGCAAGAATTARAVFSDPPVAAALIMSESGVPTPSPTYVHGVHTNHVKPNFPSATAPQAVTIPTGCTPLVVSRT
jgi:hypothetical protein